MQIPQKFLFFITAATRFAAKIEGESIIFIRFEQIPCYILCLYLAINLHVQVFQNIQNSEKSVYSRFKIFWF